MVKYSKYLLLMWVSIISLELNAQFAQESFNVIERDSEITRVTLKNYLENWKEAPLLNRIKNTEANYTKGQGLNLSIEAPNSRVFLENGIKWSFKEDLELLDTFYDEEVIALQQQRMIACLSSFIKDFHSYFPAIAENEQYVITVEVSDLSETEEEEEVIKSKKASLRHYRLKISLEAKDLNKLANKATDIKELITIETEQL